LSAFPRQFAANFFVENFIANSEKMREAVRLAERVAPTDSTVLITGESGTGKNRLARFIHQKSKRKAAVSVTIDCAALPRELLETELFGYEKGSFTGATEAKPGRLEAANEATLLLDEIALLSVEAQAKLLRVLEEREFERIGGRRTFKIDARVIATTNVDLETAVKQKTFRADLFFRLNVVRIELPPLRERQTDIADLAEHFLRFFAAKHARPNLKLKPDALDVLQNHDFPGNLRELANLIERAVIVTNENEITAAAFPVFSPSNKWLTLAELEEKHVLETLSKTAGNKTEAAKMLGISRKNLYERLARREQK
jgi:transcriptional regulator with PAS, ATPase and Fis domain